MDKVVNLTELYLNNVYTDNVYTYRVTAIAGSNLMPKSQGFVWVVRSDGATYKQCPIFLDTLTLISSPDNSLSTSPSELTTDFAHVKLSTLGSDFILLNCSASVTKTYNIKETYYIDPYTTAYKYKVNVTNSHPTLIQVIAPTTIDHDTNSFQVTYNQINNIDVSQMPIVYIEIEALTAKATVDNFITFQTTPSCFPVCFPLTV